MDCKLNIGVLWPSKCVAL